MADLIIKGGKLLTMCGEVIDNGIVAVKNGLITYVGKETEEGADKVIDSKGCIVMPGLINSHTHLSMTLLQGFAQNLPYNEWTEKIQEAEVNFTPEDIRTGALLGVLEMIKSGTTAFADMYIYMDEVAKVVQETGTRASLGYGMIEGLNEDAQTKLVNRRKFVREWNSRCNGRITTMYAPHSAASCSKEFLIKVRELSQKDGARIHIHVLETEDELALMKKRYGMCSINLLNSINMLDKNVLAVHCIWLSDDDIDILRKNRVNVVHCPSSNISLGAGTAQVPEMLEKGINVALGTDGAASGGGLDMWNEMRAALLLHKHKNPRSLHAQKVLEMATINGARAIGINAGVLRTGALADIIIVDIKESKFISSNIVESLVNGASGCDVRTTIVDGEVLMEDHIVVGLDEYRFIEDARKAILRMKSANNNGK